MIDNAELSRLLTSNLNLTTPPVALRFVQQPPEGLPHFQGEVPSACSFWRRAEQGAFYADAPAHTNCMIGYHVMGLPMSKELEPELMATLGKMGATGYFDGGEVPHMPTVAGDKSGVVYGPLASLDGEPDAVLVWLTPYQSMLLQEATGTARWSEQSGVPTFGRPSCAAIPAALTKGVATQSLGCMGMRIFTEVAQDRLLGVLPKQLLDQLPAALQKVADSNEQMAQHYRGQKAIHSKQATPARAEA